MNRFFEKYNQYIKKLTNLNWKVFNFRFSIFVAFIVALIFQNLSWEDPQFIPPLEPIEYIPVWYYAWLIGAFVGFVGWWCYVISFWTVWVIISKFIAWIIAGLYK